MTGVTVRLRLSLGAMRRASPAPTGADSRPPGFPE